MKKSKLGSWRYLDGRTEDFEAIMTFASWGEHQFVTHTFTDSFDRNEYINKIVSKYGKPDRISIFYRTPSMPAHTFNFFVSIPKRDM